MTKLTDRQLANLCYSLSGIPASKWAAHWALDVTKSTLSDSARAAYRAIYLSVERSV